MKIAPQVVGMASELVEAGRKRLLNEQPDEAISINAAADHLQDKIKQQAAEEWTTPSWRR